jgi:CHRD domain
MNIPKLLVLASLMSLALATGSAISNMTPSLYAQSNSGSNTGTSHFVATLNGNGVFPPVKTNATGKAQLDLVGDGKTMSYKITGGPVDQVKDVALSHTTGGRAADIVVLRSATQKGLSGEAKSATLTGNFTASDFIGGSNVPKDMASLVKDILSGNVIIRVDTIKFPLGIVGGKITPNLQS